ncbi:MAG TPA: hypothetical protein VGB96_01740, partial [Archangium sp.]
MKAGSGLRREVGRKVFHVASVALPALVWLAPRRVAVVALVALAITGLVVDAARLRIRWARYHFLRRTRTLLRAHERHGF